MENNVSNEWLANQSRDGSTQNNQYVYKIGIYGWRKRLLYLFMLLLLIMVIINFALMLWIVKVMDFSTDGMGKLRILKTGIRLEGEAEFVHALYVTKLKARKERSLKIESSRNLTLNARNENGDVTTRLVLGDQKLLSMAEAFIVKNREGKTLFSADENTIDIAAHMLKVSGTGGAVFQGSVQTNLITSQYHKGLKIESPTRSLIISGPTGIAVESRTGDIHASCLGNLKLKSETGAITLDSSSIILDELPLVSMSDHKSPGSVYQLCACENGKLFMAPPDGFCYADSNVCK